MRTIAEIGRARGLAKSKTDVQDKSLGYSFHQYSKVEGYLDKYKFDIMLGTHYEHSTLSRGSLVRAWFKESWQGFADSLKSLKRKIAGGSESKKERAGRAARHTMKMHEAVDAAVDQFIQGVFNNTDDTKKIQELHYQYERSMKRIKRKFTDNRGYLGDPVDGRVNAVRIAAMQSLAKLDLKATEGKLYDKASAALHSYGFGDEQGDAQFLSDLRAEKQQAKLDAERRSKQLATDSQVAAINLSTLDDLTKGAGNAGLRRSVKDKGFSEQKELDFDQIKDTIGDLFDSAVKNTAPGAQKKALSGVLKGLKTRYNEIADKAEILLNNISNLEHEDRLQMRTGLKSASELERLAGELETLERDLTKFINTQGQNYVVQKKDLCQAEHNFRKMIGILRREKPDAKDPSFGAKELKKAYESFGGIVADVALDFRTLSAVSQSDGANVDYAAPAKIDSFSKSFEGTQKSLLVLLNSFEMTKETSVEDLKGLKKACESCIADLSSLNTRFAKSIAEHELGQRGEVYRIEHGLEDADEALSGMLDIVNSELTKRAEHLD